MKLNGPFPFVIGKISVIAYRIWSLPSLITRNGDRQNASSILYSDSYAFIWRLLALAENSWKLYVRYRFKVSKIKKFILRIQTRPRVSAHHKDEKFKPNHFRCMTHQPSIWEGNSRKVYLSTVSRASFPDWIEWFRVGAVLFKCTNILFSSPPAETHTHFELLCAEEDRNKDVRSALHTL